MNMRTLFPVLGFITLGFSVAVNAGQAAALQHVRARRTPAELEVITAYLGDLVADGSA